MMNFSLSFNKSSYACFSLTKILVLFIYLIGNSLFSNDSVLLIKGKGVYNLGSHIELLEDKDGKLSIEDIVKPELKNRWFKSEKEVPSFGYTKSVYWVKFQINNPNEKDEYILEVSYPLLDKLELYISQINLPVYITKKSGDYSPYKNRDLLFHNFLFRIPIESKEIKTIFLRIETTSSMQIPLVLFNPHSLVEHINLTMIGLGIYYGIILAMLIYNLFLFLSIRDRSYLFYVLYIVSFAFLQTTVNGIVFEFLGEQFPMINDSATLFMNFSCIFIVLFVQSFLHTKKFTPLFDKILNGMLVYLICISLIFLKLSYSETAKIASVSVAFCLTLVFLIVIIILKRGYKPARYFLFAWFAFLIGSIILALRQIGILPSVFITDYGAQLGSGIEVLLLSLGLADRINIMRKEKEAAQAEAISVQRILNQELEAKVKQRTFELESAHKKIIILEKENTEKVLAGGFAHEIRNALVGPLLVIQNALGLDDSENSESITKMNIRMLNEIQSSLKEQNPTDTLESIIEPMNEVVENEEQIESSLKIIQKAIYKGMSITKTIMNYVKIGNDRTGQNAISMNTFLLNLVSQFEKEWSKNQINFHVNIPVEEIVIYGSEMHFESIFKNLILNAKDAVMDQSIKDNRKKMIEVNAQAIDNNFQIDIIDNGVGIAPTNLEKIFDTFFSTKPETGTGLGLGIVKKLVYLYDGKIDVKSELGIGTTFTVVLPMKQN